MSAVRRRLVLHVARAELTMQMRDGRVRVGMVIVAMLCAVSVLVGWKRHVDAARAIATAQAETHEQFVGQGPKNPHAGAHFGIYAYRSEGGLAFFDPGLDDVTGIAVLVEPHEPHTFSDPPIQDETSLARFGGWTGAGLAQVLLPLFVLLLAAPSITAERERGTLRALFAQGVSPFALLLGKAVGIGGTLVFSLMPAFVVLGLAALVSPTSVHVSGARALWMVLGYGLYLLSFLFFALAISARSRSVGMSVVGALGLWSFTVILGPRIAAEIALRAAPTPSAFEVRAEVARSTWASNIDEWESRTAIITKSMLAQYGMTKEDDLPVNVAGLVLDAQEKDDAPVFDRIYGALFATFQRQERVLEVSSIVAPSLAIQSLSMAAAGTDMAHRVDYWWAVERYRRNLVSIVNEFIIHHSRNADGYTFTADRDVWELVPHYTYVEPAPMWAIRESAMSFTVLLFWAAGALGLAWVAARRMPFAS